jgi:predicted nucleotidyltransferase
LNLTTGSAKCEMGGLTPDGFPLSVSVPIRGLRTQVTTAGYPFIAEFSKLLYTQLMSLRELLTEKRQEIMRLADRYGATNVRIFGSAARGEDGPASDVDLLVDAGPRRAPFFPAGLQEDLQALLHRKVDILTPGALHWYIKERVLREAKPL